MTGIGRVIISETLTLNQVLLVPKLSCNLLSISKLTRDLNCVAKFSSSHCLFQDLASRMMIGNAKESKGLYWFRAAGKQDSQAHHVSFSTPDPRLNLSLDSNKESTIMLLHYCLGHPNFMYLSKMFPALFKNKNPKLSNVRFANFLSIVVTLIHPKITNHQNLFPLFIVKFGDPLVFTISLGLDGLLALLMTILELRGYFS